MKAPATVGSIAQIGPNTIKSSGGSAAVDIQSLGSGDRVDLSSSSGSLTINATIGNDRVTAGSGDFTVYGGVGDTITGGPGGTGQIVGSAGSMAIIAGSAGAETIASGARDTITALSGAASLQISGARGDFIDLTGNSGAELVIALAGNETVVGGGGNSTIYGAAGDSTTSGASTFQILADDPAGPMTVVMGAFGNGTIASGKGDTIKAVSGTRANVSITGAADYFIDLTSPASTSLDTIDARAGGEALTLGGTVTVFGGAGDTINSGSGLFGYIDASAGRQTINLLNASGPHSEPARYSVFGAGTSAPGTGDTITALAQLIYNPGATTAGAGDFIDLSNSPNTATINAFSYGGVQLAAVNDTIAAGGGESVWGGPGDRIGVGNATTGSAANFGRRDELFDHSTSVAGAAVLFGTNSTVTAVTYSGGTSTRGSFGSNSLVTVTNFDILRDGIFYQNENAATTSEIIATSKRTTVGGSASTIITLPDGTTMTLVGVTALSPAMFKP